MRMKRDELLARRAHLIKEESAKPERWWWLSFAGEKGFLGAVIVRARGFVTALEFARLMELNPGGEVRGIELPDEAEPLLEAFANRLLSREEINEKLGGVKWQ